MDSRSVRGNPLNIPDGYHGVLAHYFHGPHHPAAQGSLSADDFARGLDALGERLISARPFLARAATGSLARHVAITFDDGLREQVEIALPVLERFHLLAFFNIYTQPYVGVPHTLELSRWLRNFAFGGVEGFYDRLGVPSAPCTYLAGYGYLSQRDKDFRYWRNEIATPRVYAATLERLAQQAPAKPHLEDHWIRPDELRALHREGHVLGFHTHTHPTNLDVLTKEQLHVEYATSRYILASILGVQPDTITTMSHPNGNVTSEGVDWMREQGITLAWGATMDGTLPWRAPRFSTGYWR